MFVKIPVRNKIGFVVINVMAVQKVMALVDKEETQIFLSHMEHPVVTSLSIQEVSEKLQSAAFGRGMDDEGDGEAKTGTAEGALEEAGEDAGEGDTGETQEPGSADNPLPGDDLPVQKPKRGKK